MATRRPAKPKHRRKPLVAPHGIGVVGAQTGLADVKGAVVQGASGGQVALTMQDEGEEVEATSGVGMVATQSRLAGGQGGFEQAAGLV
jgi:hypothetical protein